MTKKEALEILKLVGEPTQEEIKKAYRRLSKLHHPDNYMEAPDAVRLEHEEEMKKINAAYDYFEKYELDNYRMEIINKMRAYYENASIENKSLVSTIKSLVFDNEVLLWFQSDKKSLDMVFKDFLEKIRCSYIAYEDTFYGDNYIDKEEVKEIIRYDLKVDDFYQQLCRIRDKYSKKIKFENRVVEEIVPYKLYATCTENLWSLISSGCARAAITEAKKSNFIDCEAAISKMHEEIKRLFALVDAINEMFRALAEELEKISDKGLKQEYEDIKREYEAGRSLYNIKRKLGALNRKIKKYKLEQERVAKKEEEKPVVSGLYKKLINNYSSILSDLNPVNDNDKIKEITEFFQLVMNLFVRYNIGLIDIDRLLAAGEITFRDMIKDKELLSSIISGKDYDSNRLRIYIKRSRYCNSTYDNTSFFVLREDNGKYNIREIAVANCEEREITVDEVEREYISMDSVIKNAVYQGYRTLFGVFPAQNLYEINDDGDYRYIILYDGHLLMVKDDFLSEPMGAISDEFKNKEYFMDMLQEQIQDFLDKSR